VAALQAVSRLESSSREIPGAKCATMTKINDAACDLCCIRKEVLTYFGGLPSVIKNHQSAAFPSVVLSVGKGLEWFGPILDRYRYQFIPLTEDLSVTHLGKQLRELAISLIETAPNVQEIDRQVENLKLQIRLLQQIKKGGAK
jgi:hypothetical protein